MPHTVTNPEARKIRADALRIARRAGYGLVNYGGRSYHAFPCGQLEGEDFAVAYFIDAMLNGCGGELLICGEHADGEIFDLSDAEREAFDVPKDCAHAVLWYSTQGFIRLDYLTADDAERITAEYAREDC